MGLAEVTTINQCPFFVGQAFCLIGNPNWKGEPSLQALDDNTSVLVNWTGVIYNAKGKVFSIGRLYTFEKLIQNM